MNVFFTFLHIASYLRFRMWCIAIVWFCQLISNLAGVFTIWWACELFRAFWFWLAYPSVVDLALSSVATWFTLFVFVLDIAVFFVALLWELSLSVRAVDLALIKLLLWVIWVYRLDFAFPTVDLGARFGVAAGTTLPIDIAVFFILFFFLISDSILAFRLTFIIFLMLYSTTIPPLNYFAISTSISVWITIIFVCSFLGCNNSVLTFRLARISFWVIS